MDNHDLKVRASGISLSGGALSNNDVGQKTVVAIGVNAKG